MRSSPKDTGQIRKLWAYVSSAGAITLGAGGLRVTKAGTGAYDVAFPFTLPLGGGIFATTNPPANTVATVINANAAGCRVNTFNPSSGASTDTAFTVEVNVP